MDLYIDAGRFYPDKKIPIWYNEDEDFKKITGLNERLRLVLIQKGTGIVRIDEKKLSVIAPAIICINEKETVSLEDSMGWSAQAFYFHPQYLNASLTFEKIRITEAELSITDKQDTFLFKPFVERNDLYAGQLNIDQLTMGNITSLLEGVIKEITEQSHRFWSCRARSYFLELLFVLIKIYQAPETRVNNLIKNSSNLVEKIILFINTNYHRKITIAELSSNFRINRTTLQEQFQNATGQSVMSYLIILRIKLSSLMLKDTGLTISEIAERVGFSDSTHFNKMFRKYTGYSPLQYRQQFNCL